MKTLTVTETTDFFEKYMNNSQDVWWVDLNNLSPTQKYYFYNFIQLYLKKI